MLKRGSWKPMNRTPLCDISNSGRPSRDAKKKIQLDRDYDGYLDRLLLVRSKLSALVNQIDEIIAQSLKQDMKSKIANEDIESVSNLLSEMHSSLKPWALRLGQAQTTSKTAVQVCQSLQRNHTSTNRDRDISPSLKDEPKLDMIISPSPLVAWRAGGCRFVTEKQLFLLTPLSKKERFSQCPGSSKIKARNLGMKDTSDTLQLSPLAAIIRNPGTAPKTVGEFDGPKPCIVEENSTGKTRLNMPISLCPIFKSSQQDCRLRSEAYQKNKSTLSDHVGVEEVSDALSLKNQLFIVPLSSHNFTNRRRDSDEEALEWFLSPPKTCTIMDPDHGSNPSIVEEKSLSNSNPKTCTIMDPDHGSNPSIVEEKSLSNSDPKINFTMDPVDVLTRRDDRNMLECFQESKKAHDGIISESEQQLHDLQLCNFTSKRDFDETLEWFLSPPKTCTLMEPLDGKIPSTPAIVGDSVLKSRRPGENTLKKELWTKFQAVSMGRLTYKDSVLQKVVKKGFMDMLEEAT